MTGQLETSTLRILNPNGKTVGTGFLVAPNLAVTCAHVVVAAGAIDGDTVQVQFTDRTEKISALVEPKYWRIVKKGDVAFLRLESVPEGVQALRLAPAETSRPGSGFRSFGYANAAGLQGIHANGTIDGYLSEHRLLQLQSPQANHGISGGPVWDEARGVVVGMITQGHTELGRNQETTFATPAELLFEICPEIQPSETCPYLGLETFTAETARFFFGREALTEKLVSALRGGCRFLGVFGPSGSGKSSVVQAGLLTKLEGGLFAGWKQIIIRPADQPFEQLKTAGLESAENIREKTILFIDQFEELFTLCPDDLREKFIAEVVTGLDNPHLLLIISMRDDFYSAFNAKAAPLATSEHLKIENVPGMLKREELAAMIEKPANVAGLGLEDGLTERILEDLRQNGEARSSSLPLLEFALTQLWEKRSDGLLTHDSYDVIGGVTGSLARWADEAYSDLPKTDHPLTESLLTSLVHLGNEAQGFPDTRRRRSLDEFDEPIKRIIKHFADRRLLITEAETVELVHDSLVREWERLQGWLKKNHNDLRILEDINTEASRWENANRTESLLNHRGLRLELAVAISKNPRYRLNQVEQAYLDGCVALREKEKAAAAKQRKNTMIGVSVALVIIVAILVGWGLTSSQNSRQLGFQVATATYAQGFAQQQAATAEAAKATAVFDADARAIAQRDAETQKAKAENQALVALARQLAAQANSIVITTNNKKQTQAFLVAIQSLKLFPNAEAASFIINNSYYFPLSSRLEHGDAVASIAFSLDSKYMVSGSYDGTARVWDAVSGMEMARMTHDGWVNSVAFSPFNSTIVVSGSEDGTARVWQATTGDEFARMTHDGPVNSVAFSPNGSVRYVVSGSNDHTARVWKAETGKEIARMTHDDVVSVVAFSPDGKYVVSGSNDHTARVWEAETGKEIARMTHNDRVISLAFSPDGRYVVSGSWDHTARVWNAVTGKEIALVTHDGSVASVAFSPDGRYVASGSNDSTARVWETITGEEIARKTHNDSVFSVAFSPDGRYVISGGVDNSASIWDAISGQEVAQGIHNNAVWAVAFSPNSKYAGSGSYDHTARVWEWRIEDLITDTCKVEPRNLSLAEWQQYIGDALPYQAVCPGLPMDPLPTATPTQ